MEKTFRWTLVIAVLIVGVLVAVLIPFLGFGLISGGINQTGDASALAERGQYVVGTVQDKKTRSRGPGGMREKLVLVEFTAADRTEHTVWTSGDQGIGAPVRVLYDPRDPDTATGKSAGWERAMGIARIGGGILLGPVLLVAYAGFGWNRLRKRRER